MSAGMQPLKATLRAELRAKVGAIPMETRADRSAELCERLRRSELWSAAKTVLLFAPVAGEPDVWPLGEIGLNAGKVVALPQFAAATQQYVAGRVRDFTADLRAGRFGIREPLESCAPIALADVDLVFVPGIAFDPRGGRLGRGKGFYDRLLAEIATGVKCGVAFDEQIVDELPCEAHDQRVDWIVTPKRLLKISGTD